MHGYMFWSLYFPLMAWRGVATYEGGVDQGVEELAEEEAREDGREEGLRRLDDVCEAAVDVTSGRKGVLEDTMQA